jgi:hypothetical protein
MSETGVVITELGEGRLSITRPGPDGAPGTQISLSDPDVIRDPYPLYRQLRAVSPIFRAEGVLGGSWIFMNHEDVAALFRDTEHLSNAKFRALVDQLPEQLKGEFEKLISIHSRWMVFFDPPKHTRLRKLMARGFTPRVRDRLAPIVRQHVEELIRSFQGRERLDVVTEFAWEIPLVTIATILGIRKEDLSLFARWTGDIAAYMGSAGPDVALMSAAQRSLIELEGYFREVIAERRKNPIPDDLLSLLITAEEDGDVLTEEELFAQGTFLCFTGNETTKILISNAIYALLQHPEQRHVVASAPELLRDALGEIVRFECPVQFIGRIVKEDFSYKGATLKKGEYIVLMIGAANRDPRRFDRPDTFDISRKGSHHISFGEGNHACLGQSLAQMEAEIAVSAILANFPKVRLAPGESIQWNNNPGLRGLQHLVVELK